MTTESPAGAGGSRGEFLEAAATMDALVYHLLDGWISQAAPVYVS